MKSFYALLLLLVASSCSAPRVQEIKEEIAYHSHKRATPSYKPPLLITIDAGHGGKDSGAFQTTLSKHSEKELALKTALLLQHSLRDLGYRTQMTRSIDVFIPLKERAQLANQWGADIFISVHYNAAKNPSAEGIEVFYYGSDENTKRSEKSKILAQKVHDSLIEATNAKARGVKSGNLAVIRETTMPAILVEAGFLTNKNEAAKIESPHHMKKIAHAIARGLHDTERTP